jgi:hypothetical protein
MDTYLNDKRRKSRDFGKPVGGKMVIGNSNVSSLNADLSPRVDPDIDERREKQVKNNTYEIAGYREAKDDDLPAQRLEGAPRTPPRATPRQPELFMNQTAPAQLQQQHMQQLSLKSMYGNMESPLLASLEQQRMHALSLLPSGHGASPPAGGGASGMNTVTGIQPYQHAFSPQSVYGNSSHLPSPYGMQMGMSMPNPHMMPQQQQWNSVYHAGMPPHGQYNNILSQRRNEQTDVPRVAAKVRKDALRANSDEHNIGADDDDLPETDGDHRVVLPDGRSVQHLKKGKPKDMRLSDKSHGKSFEERKKKWEENDLDDDSATAPPDVTHPGPGYQGETQALQAGDPPTDKSSILSVNHKGVRQKCILEASQTLFKGHASVFLLDSHGKPLRDKAVAEFLLGAVGNLTVTVSGSAMSLQDNNDACLLECSSDIDAEEWAEYLCSSIMANRPLIRRKQHTEAHEPDSAPPSGIQASPRKRGVMFKTDGAIDLSIPGAGAGLDMTGGQKGMKLSEAMVVDSYDGDDSDHPKEDLTNVILEMEQKIASNVSSFDDKMKEKEKEMVRECKLIYTNDKKKAKTDVAALNRKLADQEGITKAQRKLETNKLKLWLESKLQKLDAINKKRLAATEKQFDEFRHNEFDRLNRINSKLKAKMKILKERQELFRKARQSDNDNAPLPIEGGDKSGSPIKAMESPGATTKSEEADPLAGMSKKARLKAKLVAKRVEKEQIEKEKAEKELAEEKKRKEDAESKLEASRKSANAKAHNSLDAPGDNDDFDTVDSGTKGGKYQLNAQIANNTTNSLTAKGAKAGEAFNDLSKKSNIIESQEVSSDNVLNKNEDIDGNKSNGGVRFVEDRPASPPIPTHQLGGSRHTEPFKKKLPNGKTVMVAPKAPDINPVGSFGASRWDDDIERGNDATPTNPIKDELYGGAGEGLGVVPGRKGGSPQKVAPPRARASPNKEEQHTEASEPPHHGEAEDDDDEGPNPNAKPLTGKGMVKKPTITAPPAAVPHTQQKGQHTQQQKGRAGKRAGGINMDVGEAVESKQEKGMGRPVSKFKDGDPRYALSYDSKMNLRHNREDYCNEMSKVIVRFLKGQQARHIANLFMAPLKAAKNEKHDTARVIQQAWFCYCARSRLQGLVYSAIYKLQNKAVFTMILYMALFIARMRRKRVRRAKVIAYILNKALQRRSILLHKRRVEGVHIHKLFKVEAPRKEAITAVPRGLTTQLQRQAQIEVEQRMRLGSVSNVINGVSKAGKAAKSFVGWMMQLDVDKTHEDPHDLTLHVKNAQAHDRDIRSGYKSHYVGAMSVNDVKAAHLRANAIASFVKIKNNEKARLLAQTSHHLNAEDSDGFDSEAD